MKRVGFVASGTVQGVFFRASTRDEARRLGVTGWVGNRADGAVEGEVQGADDDAAALLDFLRAGPGHSTVDHLDVRDLEPVEAENGFDVR